MGIVLIGYRGSGKTTLGRRLAAELNRPFLDLDELVMQRAGQTIREIFQTGGEAMFRRLESLALAENIDRPSHVFSLGGGALLLEENRRSIASARHVVIYLRADARELHRRISADPATAAQRPGLTHLGGSIEEIAELLEQREPIYQQMKTIELDAGTASIDDLVTEVLPKLKLLTTTDD